MKNKKVYFVLTFIFVIVSTIMLGCSTSCLCSRISYDRHNTQSMFGCYHKIAETGGFAGGIHDASDNNGCIVLTSDSLYKQYLGDSLNMSMKFIITWRTDRNGQQVADLSFDNGSDPDRLACSWHNDSLWVGHAGPIMDAISFLFVKCCK